MAKKSGDITTRAVLRESDNPIVEEYKEDLLKKPTYRVYSVAADDETRISRLEGLLAELRSKIESLEGRMERMEALQKRG